MLYFLIAEHSDTLINCFSFCVLHFTFIFALVNYLN